MKYYLSKERLESLKKELEQMKKHGRIKMAEQLKQAIEYGDLSENAAYHAAKDDQADLENKIIKTENIIRNAVIIEKNKTDIIQIGSTIKVKRGSEKLQYTIVGSQEADPAKNMISNESPLGVAFLGKKEKDIIEVATPKGLVKYEIMVIE